MRDYPTLHLVTKSSTGTVYLLLSNIDSDFADFQSFLIFLVGISSFLISLCRSVLTVISSQINYQVYLEHNIKHLILTYVMWLCWLFIVQQLCLVIYNCRSLIFKIKAKWVDQLLSFKSYLVLWKESLNSDGHQFHQYQQSP